MKGIEGICLDEAFNLVRREKAYRDLVAGMYLSSLVSPTRAKVLRASYFFCRNVDDIVDGDRPIAGSREDYGHKVLAYMEGEPAEGVPEIVRLYDYALRKISGMKLQERDSPKKDFMSIIESILFDFDRSKSGKKLTRQELENYYSSVFESAINLSLIIAGSELRGEDVPQVVYGQGHLLSIKHLGQDLPRGIVNIPHEVLGAAGFNGSLDYDEIAGNNTVREWVLEEAAIYHKKAHELRKFLADSDFRTKMVCVPISLNITRWADKLTSAYE